MIPVKIPVGNELAVSGVDVLAVDSVDPEMAGLKLDARFSEDRDSCLSSLLSLNDGRMSGVIKFWTRFQTDVSRYPSSIHSLRLLTRSLTQ